MTKIIKQIGRKILSWMMLIGALFFALIFAGQLEEERQDNVARMDALPVAVVTCDEAGVITFANYEATRILGWSKAELEGRPLNSILPPSMKDRHTKSQHDLIAALKNKSGDWQVTSDVPNGEAFNRYDELVRLSIRVRMFSRGNRPITQVAILKEKDVPPVQLEEIGNNQKAQ